MLGEIYLSQRDKYCMILLYEVLIEIVELIEAESK